MSSLRCFPCSSGSTCQDWTSYPSPRTGSCSLVPCCGLGLTLCRSPAQQRGCRLGLPSHLFPAQPSNQPLNPISSLGCLLSFFPSPHSLWDSGVTFSGEPSLTLWSWAGCLLCVPTACHVELAHHPMYLSAAPVRQWALWGLQASLEWHPQSPTQGLIPGTTLLVLVRSGAVCGVPHLHAFGHLGLTARRFLLSACLALVNSPINRSWVVSFTPGLPAYHIPIFPDHHTWPQYMVMVGFCFFLPNLKAEMLFHISIPL